MEQFVKATLTEAHKALTDMLGNEATLTAIAKAGQLLAETFKAGNRAYSCGNGGSMCDAMHFAEELSGRFRKDRAALPATSISDPSHLSCVANDYGYDFVFSRYIEAHGRTGDVLLAISTSGKSKNVLKAAEVAKARGVKIIALVGALGTPLAEAADIAISAQGGSFADRTQELHIKIIHILIELTERQLFPENYAA